MPCNYNQRRLAEHVKDGHPGRRRHADGVQHDLGQRRRHDGHRGHEGLAHQPRGHRRLDRARRAAATCSTGSCASSAATRRCPARRWRSAASTCPASSLYNGTIYPGVYKGQRNATVVTVYEAIGAYRAGKITLDELYEVENAACPGAGACGGQFTANTMSMVLEFIGLSPAGLNGIPAEDPAKDEAARRSGELVMDLVRRDVRPSSIVTRGVARERDRRRSRRRAARRTACCTCWRSPTSSASPLDIDEFGAIADRTPIVADLQPGGRYTARDLYDAGGVGLVMRELLQAARPPPRRRADGRRPDDRRDRRDRDGDAGPGGRRADRARRSRRPAAWPSCAARSRPTAAS